MSRESALRRVARASAACWVCFLAYACGNDAPSPATPAMSGAGSGAGAGPCRGGSGCAAGSGGSNVPLGGSGGSTAPLGGSGGSTRDPEPEPEVCEPDCELGQQCLAGSCACPNGSASDFCADIGCVDLQTNAQACGDCGTACADQRVCVAGECVCPSGKTECAGACVDTERSKANCGQCGHSCPPSQACVAGECSCTFDGAAVCGEGCADLSSDTTNCGACGERCAAGETCGGACECESGVFCETRCMPVDDAGNCGACGSACSQGQHCQGDDCACIGFGLSACDESCVDLKRDAQNCGSCGKACLQGESCRAGLCSCPAGQTFCAEAGQCVSLASDEQHCGACGEACNPSEVCSTGECACPRSGQLYCASQGACTETRRNAKHCGGCDQACNATEQCDAGSCACPGKDQEFCASANACADTQVSNAHCGACDQPCPAGSHCSAGGCTCDVATQTLCGNTCFDLATDPQHCGTCSFACADGLVCVRGGCQCPSSSVGSHLRLTNNAFRDDMPTAVWTGTHVGIAYRRRITNAGVNSYYNARFMLLKPDGSVVTDIALSDYPIDTYEGVDYDNVSLAWSGSEFAAVWTHRSETPQTSELMFRRISSAGVASPALVLATTAEMGHGGGAAIAWSASYGGYGVIFSDSSQKMHLRRVGAQGTDLHSDETGFVYGAPASSLVVAPDGRWAVGWHEGFDTHLRIFDAAGKLSGSDELRQTDGGVPQVYWDGATFGFAYEGFTVHSLFMARHGVSGGSLLSPGTSEQARAGVVGLPLNGALHLQWVEGTTLQSQRYSLAASPSALDEPITLATPAQLAVTPSALVRAGTNKLLSIWTDQRSPGETELYASILTPPACP